MNWRKILIFLIVLALPVAALAETWVVSTKGGRSLNLRSPENQSVIGHIPNGTQLEPDPELSDEINAYVTYGGQSGYVRWEYLRRADPTQAPAQASGDSWEDMISGRPGSGSSAQAATPTPVPTPAPTPAPQEPAPDSLETGEHRVQVFGATVQFADANGKGYGDTYDFVSFDGETGVVIRAVVPKKQKLSYWIINGVRYDFSTTPKYMTVLHLTEDLTVEAVFSKTEPVSLRSDETIQATRTGDRLIVDTINAQLCHLKKSGKNGGGGWITSFEFTQDYVNRATKEMETGGQISVRVKARVPGGKKVIGWKFNETEFRFPTTVNSFFSRKLNVSMTYEPIYGKAAPAVTTRVPGQVYPAPTTPHKYVTYDGDPTYIYFN